MVVFFLIVVFCGVGIKFDVVVSVFVGLVNVMGVC